MQKISYSIALVFVVLYDIHIVIHFYFQLHYITKLVPVNYIELSPMRNYLFTSDTFNVQNW